jgi:hypothetical protein
MAQSSIWIVQAVEACVFQNISLNEKATGESIIWWLFCLELSIV